jgi:hypothetical protein
MEFGMKHALLGVMVLSFLGIGGIEAGEGNWKVAIGSVLLAGANGALIS